MSRAPINLGLLRFDRTAALIDGRIDADGINVLRLPGGKASVGGFLGGSLDAADVPFARYVFWKSQGMRITGIPVFTDRLFQHQYIYTRTDTGIDGLGDLRGRRVMSAPSYFSTPSFWHRALLKEEHGILPEEIQWHAAAPEADRGMRIPDGVRVTISPDTLLGLDRLLDGTVEALMTARTAWVADEHRDRIRRVIPDAEAAQRAWVKAHRCFPMLHIVALHEAAVAARPTLPLELCRLFDESKLAAYRLLQDERMTGLPLMRSYLDDTIALFGDDPWPYGLAANRAQIDRFLGYAQEQGLTERRLSPEELFDPEAASYAFQARMRPGAITGLDAGGWAPEATP